ncbi:MAG: polysaccharide deacetylase family protein [Clostridia bacterium]|nr:polysaccharide deacetylase family protein [Clostridia bacterium]
MYVLMTGRRLLGILGAVALVLTGGVGLTLAARVPDTALTAAGNWGLSFQTEGAPPVGNATAAQLAEHNAYYVGDTAQKRIYLTFDAGYENGYTAPILDALKKHQVPATFFVVGHYLESAPELVCRMVEEGHIVANHTDSHPDMSAIAGRQAFLTELAGAEAKYRAVTGQEMPKIYRPPQGKYSTQNLQMACEAGYHTFFWSLAYVDWYVDRQPTREQALDKLLGRIHPGAIVLLHSTSATNAAIMDELLTKWKEMGYTFGALTELYETGGAY